MTNKKYNRVVKLLECHPGPQTVKAVFEQIPESIWARCASKDIAAAESTGAEILDSSPTEALVWVAPLNKAVSITA